MEEETKSKRRNIKKLWFIPIGIILAFFLITALDRILATVLNQAGYFFVLRPYYNVLANPTEFTVRMQISPQGLRNPIVKIPKAKNVYRILALGDSFTFGWGVEQNETWVAQLGKKLHISGKHIEMVNAAAPGMEPGDELLACQAYADRMQADAVIIGLNSTEDFAQRYLQSKNEENESIWQKMWPTLFRIPNKVIAFDWLQGRQLSIVTSEYWNIIGTGFLQQNPTIAKTLSPAMLTLFTAGKISPYPEITAYFYPDYYSYVLEPGIVDAGRKAFAQKISQIQSECIDNRPAAVVFLPSQGFINEQGAKNMETVGFSWDRRLLSFDFDSFYKPIYEKLNISYISPLKEFRKTGCPNCYYPIDEHLTPLGDTAVADYIAPFIEDLITKRK